MKHFPNNKQRGFLLNPSRFNAGGGGGGGDPFWNNVKLLLKMGGTEGSTTFTDLSPLGNILTRVSSPIITTAFSVEGGSSGKFTRLGYINAINAAFAPGTADFTIEAYVRHQSNSGANQFGAFQFFTVGPAPVQNQNNIAVLDNTGQTWGFYRGGGFQSTALAIVNNVWNHVAFSRNGSTLRFFVDGVLVTTLTNTFNFTGTGLSIGSYWSSAFNFDGWIDLVRLTVGVGRYTSNFTPPTDYPLF